MKTWLARLASLRLTVILVLAVSAVLAAATIIESLRGAEAARAVYASTSFYLLLAFFGVNLIAALIERWPRNRWRVGFALTHASIVLILIGALGTLLFKVEGRMPIWEGESAHAIFRDSRGEELAPLELPFALRLEAFEIDYYPGTRRPAMFRSRVVVVDPATAGGERPAVIEMNRPLRHGGYSFFQSSYQIQGGREMTILSVAHDPGEPVVFLGYALLLVGMSTVFATRFAQQRQVSRRPRLVRLEHAAVLVASLLGAAAASAAPPPATVPDAAVVATLRALPVQSDGRTMPLDTLARNAVWSVTGQHAWPGIDPVAMLLGWTADARGWAEQPIVRVKRDVAAAIGLPAGTRYASFRELVENEKLGELVGAARAKEQRDEKLGGLDKHAAQLEERLRTLDDAFRGGLLRPVPSGDPNEAWGAARPGTPAPALVELAGRLRAAAPAGYPDAAAMAREIRYNRVRPARLAWWLLVPATLLAAWALARESRPFDLAAGALVVAAFAVMTWGLAVRWQIAGRIPASNMFESMLFLGWGVGLAGVVSVALRPWLQTRMLIVNAAAMSALAMALVDLLPVDPFVHPMPPVLAGTPWLAIHVPIIMVAYAMLAIVTFFAHLVVGVEIFAPGRRDLAERWSRLAYWYTHLGSILLIAGILTGSVWAASSWGRYWGWDPKEVWSLVAFLAYMTILHARFDLQIRDFGVAVGAIAAFWAILMTYLGVNFVLASGLHSYGFGSSSLVRAMAGVALVEVLFLAAGWRAVRLRAQAVPAAA